MDQEHEQIVDLAMNGGGKKMDALIKFISENLGSQTGSEDIISPAHMDDSAVIELKGDNNKIVITTDSHTVDPVFFTGGNIGDLSIAGTVNDLTVMGAEPKYLTIGMIIEEGFKFSDLSKIVQTIGKRARETGVRIVAGDTKVMPKGDLSNIILNTAGFGLLIREYPISDAKTKPGDKIILTGSIGDHGTSLMALREGMDFQTDLPSDAAPFWPAFRDVVKNTGIHSMKDITRGGLASASNEIADKSGVCLVIDSEEVIVKPEANAICDILGLEIYEISCEGRAIMAVDPDEVENVIAELHKYELSKEAKVVGYVEEAPKGQVHIITDIGGKRILDKPYGEPIPRVC